MSEDIRPVLRFLPGPKVRAALPYSVKWVTIAGRAYRLEVYRSLYDSPEGSHPADEGEGAWRIAAVEDRPEAASYPAS